MAKLFSYLEANAETYWVVPEFELSRDQPPNKENGNALTEAERWADEEDEDDGLFSAAYENMSYHDSTDDGVDASFLEDSTGGSTDFELEEEAQRLGRRLAFLATVARLWKEAAVAWDAIRTSHERRELFDSWQSQATTAYASLSDLIEAVHGFTIRPPTGTHESNMEYDRRRMVKDSLVEQIIATAVEMADAARLLAAASGRNECRPRGKDESDDSTATSVLRAVLAGDGAGVREHWLEFIGWISQQELLYVPLAKGGKPRRIVRRGRWCN